MFDELSMHACTKQNNKCLVHVDGWTKPMFSVRMCGPDDEPEMHSADDRNMHACHRKGDGRGGGCCERKGECELALFWTNQWMHHSLLINITIQNTLALS
jgi:hypothetical protein